MAGEAHVPPMCVLGQKRPLPIQIGSGHRVGSCLSSGHLGKLHTFGNEAKDCAALFFVEYALRDPSNLSGLTA